MPIGIHEGAGQRDRVKGDARLKMEEAADASYDMVILDAFTSDAIPVHLLTREALDLYLRKLDPGGLLVAHISNRYLGLEPVLGNPGPPAAYPFTGKQERIIIGITVRREVHFMISSSSSSFL